MASNFLDAISSHWPSGWGLTHIAFAGLALYTLILATQVLRDPFQSVPLAASGVRYTRLWYFWQLWKGDFQYTNIDLHKQYGKIVRVTPHQYSIDDPEAVRIIYGHGTKFTKSDWYLAAAAPQTIEANMFAQQNIKKHSELRRKYQNFYAMSTLVQYEDHINECVSKFSEKLDQFSASGKILDFGHWLQCYAFDVITKITFDRRFGFLDDGEDIGGVIQSIDNFNLYAAVMGVYPGLHAKLSMFGPLVGLKYIISYVNTALQERRQQKADGKDLSTIPDFVSKFFITNEKDPNNFGIQHIFGGAATNVVAGTDTTAIALSTICKHLFTHPEVLDKLRKELKEARADGTISDPITFQESLRLKYFQVVIKEAMRLHPSAGLPMWRVVPEGGAMISGRLFPAGTEVGINPWVAHRNKNVFGADADVFRPERWLGDSEKVSAMDHYSLSFGAGSRTCIGRHISMLEISKLIPQLVQKFDVEPAWKGVEDLNRWFVKMKGLTVRVKSRSDVAH